MSHEFESGFVVRQQAWHGLANVLPENPSVEDALKHSGLDWDVLERPMKTTVEETVADESGVWTRNTDLEVPDGKVLVRSSDMSVLGYTSKQFNPFQNRDAFGWFQALIDEGLCQLETGGSLQQGRKVWLQARYGDAVEVKDGDALIPYLLLANGHDGKMSLRIQNTPIRVVCWNTMQAAGAVEDGDTEQVVKSGMSISHKGDVVAKAEAARKAIVQMNTDLGMTVDTYRKMTGMVVSEDHVRTLAKEVFDADYVKAKALISKFRERQEWAADDVKEAVAAKIAELESVLNTQSRVEKKVVQAFHESPGCEGKTAWDAFNAITHHIDHGSGGGAERRLTSSWFGEGSRKRAKAYSMIAEAL